MGIQQSNNGCFSSIYFIDFFQVFFIHLSIHKENMLSVCVCAFFEIREAQMLPFVEMIAPKATAIVTSALRVFAWPILQPIGKHLPRIPSTQQLLVFSYYQYHVHPLLGYWKFHHIQTSPWLPWPPWPENFRSDPTSIISRRLVWKYEEMMSQDDPRSFQIRNLGLEQALTIRATHRVSLFLISPSLSSHIMIFCGSTS